MSDNNNNNNMFGTPNKKKRNELLDASFLSPHHVTSVMGSNVNLASPEMNNLMSVFMSPTLTTSQYNQNVPDSKDWTPSIQNKLPNDGFLTFPDTVTPGLFAQNNSSIHASRNSFSNLRPLNNNSSNNNSSSSNTSNINQNSNNLPSGGLSLSNLGTGNNNGLSSLTQNQLHGGLGVSGVQGLASPSLMSPLFPDLLDSNNNRAHPLSLVGNNDDLFFGVQSGSLLHHNHNSNSSGNNSNHFAQNAEALKNRLNKRKSSSSSSDALSHMAGNTSLFSQATGHASSQPHSAHAAAHSNNSSMLPLSQSDNSQLSVSSDISGIAAITAAAAFMPPSAAQHQGLHPHSATQKKKLSAKKSDSRMDEDVNKSNDHQHHNEDEDEDEDEEDPQHSTGQANRSFMSPEMRELSMRSITPKSAPHTGGNNSNNLIVCNCKKSKCLKMYCDCFRLSEYCKAGCNCVECCNIEKFDALRLSARKSIQDRNPEAFKPRVKEEQKEHLTGCHCRKSACLKKYCECYTGKVPCSNRCRCVDCQNVPSLYTNKQLANMGSVSGVATAPNTATGLSRSGTAGSTSLPSSNVKYTTLNQAIPYINTTNNNANTTTSSSNSQQNSAEKDLQSTSPSAAVAVLQTLSASKVFNQQSFLSNADNHPDQDRNAKPVKLFEDEDDDFHKSNTTTSNNTTTTTSDALQIDTLTDKTHLQSLAQRTQSSTSQLNNGNGNVYRDVCPGSGMDSTTSLLPPQTSHNTNNTAVYGAFSPPQSPIRPTNRGNLSAVTSPKLMELADWCEERQPSREIEYPLPKEPASTDAK